MPQLAQIVIVALLAFSYIWAMVACITADTKFSHTLAFLMAVFGFSLGIYLLASRGLLGAMEWITKSRF